MRHNLMDLRKILDKGYKVVGSMDIYFEEISAQLYQVSGSKCTIFLSKRFHDLSQSENIEKSSKIGTFQMTFDSFRKSSQ